MITNNLQREIIKKNVVFFLVSTRLLTHHPISADKV